MSFYMATCFPDRVEMLTDGAGWDEAGVLRAKMNKITLVTGYPVAITSRGRHGMAKRVINAVSSMVQQAGSLDLAMTLFGQVLPDHAGSVAAGDHVDICIAGCSPDVGARIYYFRTVDEPGFVEAWKMNVSAGTVVCGIDGAAKGMPWHQQVQSAGSLRKGGVEFVEMFRRTTNKPDGVNGLESDAYANAGGHLDLTTITADGVKTERIHDWDDEIGQRADPFKGSNVTPFAQPMNRHQRRAAARLSA